jgi:peptidyl-tRNA hydrolase, PTH1 family
VALRRSRDEARRGTPSALVIVGLANPGLEYAGSRHNVGGDAVRAVCERRGITLKLESRQRALSASLTTTHGVVTLAVPTTYMNESGAALPALLKRTSLGDFSRLVIAHDELDMDPGRLQLRFGGGLAGHNGLRSIANVLGTNEFARLRIGIGRPARKEQVTDYVLKPLVGKSQKFHLEHVSEAADALELLLDSDFADAQQRVNGARG